MPKIPMALRIDPDVKAKIETQAAAERRSLANLIETVMSDYCDGKLADARYADIQIKARRKSRQSD